MNVFSDPMLAFGPLAAAPGNTCSSGSETLNTCDSGSGDSNGCTSGSDDDIRGDR